MDLALIQIVRMRFLVPFSYIIPGAEEAPVTIEQFFKHGFCPLDSRKLDWESKQRAPNVGSLIDVAAVVVDDQESAAPGHDEYILVISTVAAKEVAVKDFKLFAILTNRI